MVALTIDRLENGADALCQEGHRLASALYQAIMPKPIRQEKASVRSCFRVPLDAQPYLNTKAVALPISAKPLAINALPSDDLTMLCLRFE